MSAAANSPSHLVRRSARRRTTTAQHVSQQNRRHADERRSQPKRQNGYAEQLDERNRQVVIQDFVARVIGNKDWKSLTTGDLGPPAGCSRFVKNGPGGTRAKIVNPQKQWRPASAPTAISTSAAGRRRQPPLARCADGFNPAPNDCTNPMECKLQSLLAKRS